MKKIQSAANGFMLVACVGMLFPHAVWGESPVIKQQQSVLDVTLHDGGLLVGQVVDSQGSAKDGVEVSITSKGKELARTKTDAKGRYAIKGLHGGVYQLASAKSAMAVRVWSQKVAPPSSAIGVMLVEGTAVRGQCSCKSHGSGYTSGAGVSNGYTAGYTPGGYSNSGNYGGAASFNQGGQSGVVSGHTYDAGVVTHGDAGATYVDGSSGYYDGSTTVGGGQVYSDGGSYAGGTVSSSSAGTTSGATTVTSPAVSYGSPSSYTAGGYSAGQGGYSAGGYSYAGGTAAATTGGGLLGSGGLLGGGGAGIFGGAGLLSSPWVIGAGVAAAVAIPVALDDDDAS